MASVGFQGAYAQQAMADQVRQRIMDELSQAKDAHTMGLQDAELKLHQQEADQNAQDRAQLRQQQGQGFNEKLAEGLGTNLGPGQTVISPELAKRFTNTTLAPLVQPDQTLPSTQIASGMSAPGSDNASTAPTVTNQAPKLTGQLRFMGTPQANAQQAFLANPALPPNVKLGAQAEQAGLKVPSNLWEQKDTSALDQARIQSLTDNARNAAERIRIEGDSASARSAVAQANADLAREKLAASQQHQSDTADAWVPLPGAQEVTQPDGTKAFPFSNKRGEVKLVPTGGRAEKVGQGGMISDAMHSLFGGSSAPSQGDVWVRDASGKLVKQTQP